jgi:hypothetical protein
LRFLTTNPDVGLNTHNTSESIDVANLARNEGKNMGVIPEEELSPEQKLYLQELDNTNLPDFVDPRHLL